MEICPPCSQNLCPQLQNSPWGHSRPSWMERWREQSSLCCFHGISPVSMAMIPSGTGRLQLMSPEEGTGDPRKVSLSLLTGTPGTSRGMQQEKEGKQRESQLPGCPKGARCGSGWAAGAGASRQPEEERSLPALRIPLLPPHTLPAATPLPCKEWHKFLCRQTLVLLRIATFRALAKSLIWPGCLIPECL